MGSEKAEGNLTPLSFGHFPSPEREENRFCLNLRDIKANSANFFEPVFHYL